LHRFLNPNSVAVIGASATPGRVGHTLVTNLLRGGFRGRVYPVNPRGGEIEGLKVFPDVTEVPERPDLALIGIQPSLVPHAIEECASKGVKAAVVYSAGFADAGAEGRKLQQELSLLSQRYGIRLIGPNTQGVLNLEDRFWGLSAPTLELFPHPGPVSFICQSALFPWEYILRNAYIGINKVVDLGNMCDLDHAECLEFLGADPGTKVIVLEIEGLKDGRKFREAAAAVAASKPVLALKIGRTPGGSRAVASHTGSLAGSDEVYDAFFRQAGIYRLEDMDDLEDITRALVCLPPVRGRRVGILTTTGAGGAMAADACERAGLEVARLSGETIARIKEAQPPWVQIGNPVDVWQVLDPERLKPSFLAAWQALDSAPELDAVFLIAHMISFIPEFSALDILLRTAEAGVKKPTVLWAVVDDDNRGYLHRLSRHGIVAFPTLGRAAKALAVAYEFRDRLAR